jgi:hypothetical protein
MKINIDNPDKEENTKGRSSILIDVAWQFGMGYFGVHD